MILKACALPDALLDFLLVSLNSSLSPAGNNRFSDSGNFTFEGAVGFRVTWSASEQCLVPVGQGESASACPAHPRPRVQTPLTMRPRAAGSIVVERLSREKEDMGTKYTNLLATMGVPMLYRKTVTGETAMWRQGAQFPPSLR